MGVIQSLVNWAYCDSETISSLRIFRSTFTLLNPALLSAYRTPYGGSASTSETIRFPMARSTIVVSWASPQARILSPIWKMSPYLI